MCGGGCGEVIAIAAAFIVPELAPALSSMMVESGVVSGMLASEGAASVLLGAGLGGVASMANGGDFFSGAAMGGLGAGIGSVANSFSSAGNTLGNSFNNGTLMSDVGDAASNAFGGAGGSVSNAVGNVAGGAVDTGTTTMGNSANMGSAGWSHG